MEKTDILIRIALDLTSALKAEDRYQRLLDSLRPAIPYDAAALLRIDGNTLIPVAARGLSPGAEGRQYTRSDHPRLDIICSSEEPVRFPTDSALPDPFDGLLAADADSPGNIRACLGCPLRVEDTLIGALTVDALDPHAFDHLDHKFLKALGALAGAHMQTALLIDVLEHSAERQGRIASDLMQDFVIHRGSQMIGSSPVMNHLRREIELVARSDFTVLVLGETGVGKELVARAIHRASPRAEGAMLYLNCAALPETLAESELFGHAKGAFTGAGRDRSGKFELADDGTLFLDEIGELPMSIQAKLLRVIQEHEVQRLGSEKTRKVDVRLLVATNRDLEAEVENGRFRADLFHRLNVYPITVPPLRDRKQDISLLTGYFCERTQRRLGLGPVRISPEVFDALSGYHWPGNVRELENIISRTVLKASSGLPRGERLVIYPNHLGDDFSPDNRHSASSAEKSKPSLSTNDSLSQATKNFQRQAIQGALLKNEGNWAATARDLRIDRSNLHKLATKLGLRKR